MMKKSYLSKQMIAVIVIATVLVVAIPLYFFLLKPLFERQNEPEPTVYEPLVEGEKRSGTILYMSEVEEGKTQTYRVHTADGDWGFEAHEDGSISITEYESISYSYLMLNTHNAMKRTAASHVAPSSDELSALRLEKAEKMSEKELEELGGLSMVVLTNEDIAKIKIDLSEYGLAEEDDPDYFTAVDKNGKEQTVYLGNFVPGGGERYAMYKGRNVVYKLNANISTFVSTPLYGLMAPIVTEVGEGAYTGDYMPDRFVLYRDGKLNVAIQLLTSEQAMSLDRITKSVVVKTIKGENGEDIVNLYDTSTEYSGLLYEYFREAIDGTEVVYAVKSELKTINGVTGYMHGDISNETLLSFGIDPEKPYRSFSYSKENEKLEYSLIFSTPQKDENGEYYYAYNLGRGIIVKVYREKIPFVDKEETYYISKFISVLLFDNVDKLSIDSTGLPDEYIEGNVKKLDEEFKLKFRMNAAGTEKILDSNGNATLLDVIDRNGNSVPKAGNTSGIDNFRRLYYQLQKMSMYTNVEEQLEQIEKVDLDDPNVVVTYTVFSADDRTHTLKFYFHDTAGVWAFYTLDGEGRYIVRVNDLMQLLTATNLVMEGKSVAEVLGDV